MKRQLMTAARPKHALLADSSLSKKRSSLVISESSKARVIPNQKKRIVLRAESKTTNEDTVTPKLTTIETGAE